MCELEGQGRDKVGEKARDARSRRRVMDDARSPEKDARGFDSPGQSLLTSTQTYTSYALYAEAPSFETINNLYEHIRYHTVPVPATPARRIKLN